MNYLILDIETTIDLDRVIRTDAEGIPQGLTKEQVAHKVLEEICAKQESRDPDCFIPARYHAPVVVCMLVVDEQMRYLNHLVIAGKDYREVTKKFWDSFNNIPQTLLPMTLVSFNGLKFDMPVLETCGLDYGCALGRWVKIAVKPWDDPRHQTSHEHLDLYSFLTSRGSLGGSLNFWSRNVGMPGKISSDGSKVSEILKRIDGVEALVDYCCCDVISTYGLLYRTLFCCGHLTADYRGPIFDDTMTRLFAGRGAETKAYRDLHASEGLF